MDSHPCRKDKEDVHLHGWKQEPNPDNTFFFFSQAFLVFSDVALLLWLLCRSLHKTFRLNNFDFLQKFLRRLETSAFKYRIH